MLFGIRQGQVVDLFNEHRHQLTFLHPWVRRHKPLVLTYQPGADHGLFLMLGFHLHGPSRGCGFARLDGLLGCRQFSDKLAFCWLGQCGQVAFGLFGSQPALRFGGQAVDVVLVAFALIALAAPARISL
ncbi:hypothetical protein D3C85_1332900 [compost metagenome]